MESGRIAHTGECFFKEERSDKIAVNFLPSKIITVAGMGLDEIAILKSARNDEVKKCRFGPSQSRWLYTKFGGQEKRRTFERLTFVTC